MATDDVIPQLLWTRYFGRLSCTSSERPNYTRIIWVPCCWRKMERRQMEREQDTSTPGNFYEGQDGYKGGDHQSLYHWQNVGGLTHQVISGKQVQEVQVDNFRKFKGRLSIPTKECVQPQGHQRSWRHGGDKLMGGGGVTHTRAPTRKIKVRGKGYIIGGASRIRKGYIKRSIFNLI